MSEMACRSRKGSHSGLYQNQTSGEREECPHLWSRWGGVTAYRGAMPVLGQNALDCSSNRSIGVRVSRGVGSALLP